MEVYRICFCGHRKIYGYKDLEERIENLVKKAIRKYDYVEFYLGRNGDFDILAASAVRRAQKSLGNENNSLILVQPYKMRDDSFYINFFDEINYPIDQSTHFKQAIFKRNKWMIENSDLLICFVMDKNSGGADRTLKYATKIGIKTINIAEEYNDNEE